MIGSLSGWATYLGPRRRGPFPGAPGAAWDLYPRRWLYGGVDSAYRAAIRQAEIPYTKQPPAPSLHLPLIGIRPWVPQVEACREAVYEARLRLLRIQLALREHQVRTGAFPRSIEELAPGVLESVPSDPFTARPFLYRRSAEGYVLYSAGPDGRDDGSDPISVGAPRPSTAGDLVAGVELR